MWQPDFEYLSVIYSFRVFCSTEREHNSFFSCFFFPLSETSCDSAQMHQHLPNCCFSQQHVYAETHTLPSVCPCRALLFTSDCFISVDSMCSRACVCACESGISLLTQAVNKQTFLEHLISHSIQIKATKCKQPLFYGMFQLNINYIKLT